MKRCLSVPVRALVALPCALFLVACGQQSGQQTGQQAGQQAGQAESSPRTASEVGSCSPDSAKVTGASEVASLDLDGDGTPEKVMLTADSAAGCASYLVATVAGSTHGVPLGDPGSGLDPAAPAPVYTAVSVPGRTGQLLVVRTSNPRGGSQDTLFGYAGTDFGPVQDATGQPLQLPFVATDTSPGTGFAAVSCTSNGFVVQEAVPHQPSGVAAAFDVMETAYSLDGLTATAGTATKVGDNVLPQKLPTSYPALARNASFSSGCS